MTSLVSHRSRALPTSLRDDPSSVTFNDGESRKTDDRPAVISEKAQNTLVMSYARDEWIQRKLFDRESEYLEFRNLQLFCGTFNANGKSPSTTDVTRWLLGGASDTSQMQDIYVCSFQEIVDLNAANVIAEGHSAKRTSQWAEIIGDTLNRMAALHERGSGLDRSSRPQGDGSSSGGSFDGGEWGSVEEERKQSGGGGEGEEGGDGSGSGGRGSGSGSGAYRLIATKYLVGIAIVAFVKEKHAPNVRDVQVQTAGIGIGGFVGNKGAATLRFSYGNSTICIVSSHLSAHRNAVASRNSDFHNILSKILFKDSDDHHSPGHSILDHDYVFWLGDLNYRLHVDISVEECYRRIRSNDLKFLKRHDQLNTERAAGRAFDGFEEGDLNFNPTYKYIPGEDRYDDRPDKKMRAPAWCDRVLWSCRAGNQRKISKNDGSDERTKLVSLQKYQREDSIKISDHKPVFAIFNVQVKMIVRAEQKRVYE